MEAIVRSYLIDVAKKQQITHYQDLCDNCKLGLDMSNPSDRNKVGAILGDILEFEHNNQRPLLSALVVHKGDQKIGYGFFEICESLGIMNAKTLEANEFGIIQVSACHEFWRNKTNYALYK